jgi:hypothetical protein
VTNIDQKFKPLGYTSEVLWHFVTSSDDALDLLIDKLLSRDENEFMRICIRKDPKDQKHHTRLLDVVDTTYGGESSLPQISRSITILEPKAVCFADIPLHNLDIHMERYKNGIGLGFQKKFLMERFQSEIQPVHYYHSITQSILSDISDEGNQGERKLKPYSKIPTIKQKPDESFDSIYLEREWRILSDVNVSAEELAFIALRDRSDFSKFHKSPYASKLLSMGVSIVNIAEIFPRENRL